MTPKERFIRDSIDNTLRRCGLPCDAPLKKELGNLRAALKCMLRGIPICFRDAADRIVTLDKGLDELRNDPNFSRYFPAEKPRI
jgi:hypothetical protein